MASLAATCRQTGQELAALILKALRVIESENLNGYPAFRSQRTDRIAVEREVLRPDLQARMKERKQRLGKWIE